MRRILVAAVIGSTRSCRARRVRFQGRSCRRRTGYCWWPSTIARALPCGSLCCSAAVHLRLRSGHPGAAASPGHRSGPSAPPLPQRRRGGIRARAPRPRAPRPAVRSIACHSAARRPGSSRSRKVWKAASARYQSAPRPVRGQRAGQEVEQPSEQAAAVIVWALTGRPQAQSCARHALRDRFRRAASDRSATRGRAQWTVRCAAGVRCQLPLAGSGSSR